MTTTTTTTTFNNFFAVLKEAYENGEVLASEIKEIRDTINAFDKEVTLTEKECRKEKAEAVKEALAEKGKLVAVLATTVVVNYKDQTLTGTVVKVAEKTFTIETIIDGEAKKIWRYYHQINGL